MRKRYTYAPAALLAGLILGLGATAQARPLPGAPPGPCDDHLAELRAAVEEASLPDPGRITGLLATGSPIFYTGFVTAQGKAADRVLNMQVRGLLAAGSLAPIPIPVEQIRGRHDAVYLTRLLRAAVMNAPGGRSMCMVSAYTRDWNVRNWSEAVRQLMAPFKPPPRPNPHKPPPRPNPHVGAE